MAMFGRNAFWMELDAVDRQRRVPETHDMPVLARRIDDQLGRNILDDQRVIARRREGRWEPGEEPAPVMRYLRCFPVHQPAAHDAPAEMLPDRLMAKADSEQGLARLGTGRDKIEADACLIGRARAGRDEEGLRAGRDRLPRRNRIVAHDFHLGPQFHQVMDKVPGKAVIIVDDQDHGAGP